MRKGLFLLDGWACDQIYGQELVAKIGSRIELVGPPCDAAGLMVQPELLREVELIFGGWGTPKMDAGFLALAPKLDAIFYGAGTIRQMVGEEFWARKIAITSASVLNAIPVAEYAFSVIVLSLKHFWQFAATTRRTASFVQRDSSFAGGYRATVGLVSLGATGRRLVAMLRSMEVEILAYDPYCSSAEAAALGVQLASLDELFTRSSVVSVHAPHTDETEGMITGPLLNRLAIGGAFVNTARGAVVREDEMIEVLRSRPDLMAILDVTSPEPPVSGSPLYTLPNVILTPHIAGSVGRECRRLGQGMLDELDRYLAGKPLNWAVTQEQFPRLA